MVSGIREWCLAQLNKCDNYFLIARSFKGFPVMQAPLPHHGALPMFRCRQPTIRLLRFALRRQDGRTSTVNQEGSQVSVATFAVMIEARFQIDCHGKGLLFHSLLTFQTPSALTLISIALDQMPNATNGF